MFLHHHELAQLFIQTHCPAATNTENQRWIILSLSLVPNKCKSLLKLQQPAVKGNLLKPFQNETIYLWVVVFFCHFLQWVRMGRQTAEKWGNIGRLAPYFWLFMVTDIYFNSHSACHTKKQHRVVVFETATITILFPLGLHWLQSGLWKHCRWNTVSAPPIFTVTPHSNV